MGATASSAFAARAWAGGRDWSAVGAAYHRVHAGEGGDFVAHPSVEAHLPPRRPSKPLTLLFLVNRGCNLKCRFCDLWQGWEQVPVDNALALFDDAVAGLHTSRIDAKGSQSSTSRAA